MEPREAPYHPGTMSRRVLGSALVVVTIGSLLHFAWEWSGRSSFVAIFAATNESTWEHLKLAFWPALLISPVQRWVYGSPPGWLVATAVRTLLPPGVIVALFHGYTAVLGTNFLVLDIGTFVAAILVGEFAGHSVANHRPAARVRVLAVTGLIAGIVAFSTLSFNPPSGFLFDDPLDIPHGGVGGDPGAGRGPAMSGGAVAIALLGAATGLRSLAAPSQLSRQLRRRKLPVPTGSEWLGNPWVHRLLRVGAIGEMIADKLPGTPARVAPGPLAGRVLLGAGSGAGAARLHGLSAARGAVLGGVGAVLGAFAGYHTRRVLVRSAGNPDFAVALGEDIIAVALARAALRHRAPPGARPPGRTDPFTPALQPHRRLHAASERRVDRRPEGDPERLQRP